MCGRIARIRNFIVAAVIGAVVSAYFLVPSPASAAETYNSAQLKYIFSGAKWQGEGGQCGPGKETVGPYTPIFDLEFQTNMGLAIKFECPAAWGGPWGANESGEWSIEGNKLCIKSFYLARYVQAGESCWKIVKWQFGFAAINDQGQEAWKITLNSHPKHSSKEEIWAALKGVSGGTETAESMTGTTQAASDRSSNNEAYNSAQLEYIFSGAEVEGVVNTCYSTASALTGSANIILNFKSNGKLDYTESCSASNETVVNNDGPALWKINDGQICIDNPLGFKYAEVFGNNSCWKIAKWQFGFAAINDQRQEAWKMTLNSHPKHSSKEEIWAALETVTNAAEIADQKAKKEAEQRKIEEARLAQERQAEAQSQQVLKSQRQREERLQQEEEARRLAEDERKKQRTAQAKKRKEGETRKAAAQAKAKAEEATARKVVEPRLAAVSDKLHTCLLSSPIPADQLDAEITALNQHVSCYDTALKEVNAVKTPVKSVQGDIDTKQETLSGKRKDVVQFLTQKQTQAQQIADAAAERREEAKRKRTELVLRKKLAGSSDLFKGDARDFVFLANLSSKNVTLGLSGAAAFLTSPIPTCYVAPTKIDEGDKFTADAVGFAKAKTKSNMTFNACGDLDTETSDLIVFRRGIINNANIGTLNKLVSAQKDGVMSQYYVAEATVFDGRKLADKKAAEEAENKKQETIKKIRDEVQSGKREGFGFVVGDQSSSVVCIEDGDRSAGAARIVTKKELGAPDHIRNRPVTVMAANLEKTFLNMKLKKCGTVFANAKSLAMIYKAFKRDKIDARFSHVWVETKTIAEQAKLGKDDERKAGVESKKVVEKSKVKKAKKENEQRGNQKNQENVLLRVSSLEPSKRGCQIKFQMNNHTNRMFKDFAPKIIAMDKSGFEVGENNIGTETDNFRPKSIVTFKLLTANVPCDGVGKLVATGWKYKCKGCDKYLRFKKSELIGIENLINVDRNQQGTASSNQIVLNSLERTLHPTTGSNELFLKFQDNGGLNQGYRFFGLLIKEIVIKHRKSGGIYQASLRASKSYSSKDVRNALSKLCTISKGKWKLKRGEYQSGEGQGKLCKALYLPFNKKDWSLVYEVYETTNSKSSVDQLELNLTRSEKRLVQRGLASKGHYNSSIDGDFGQGTQSAIKKYQKAIGAVATGILNRIEADNLIDAGKKQNSEADARAAKRRKQQRERAAQSVPYVMEAKPNKSHMWFEHSRFNDRASCYEELRSWLAARTVSYRCREL